MLDKGIIIETYSSDPPLRHFVEVRDPTTGRLLLRVSLATDEVEVKHKNDTPKIISLKTLRVVPN